MTFSFPIRLLMAGLAAVAMSAVSGVAQAFPVSLYLGSTYVLNIASNLDGNIKTETGGSIDISSINGTPLPYVYCVDIFDNVNVGAQYDNTTATLDGTVNGAVLHNADKVAVLLQQFAGSAGTNQNLQGALQAAIWHEIYDGSSNAGLHTYDMVSNPGSNDAMYNAYLADVAFLTNNPSAHTNLANFLWLTPGGNNSLQGLVTSNSVPGIPEPAFYQMGMFLAGGGLMALRLRRKNRK